MCENCLPHTQLELVHQVRYEHPVKIEPMFEQAHGEGILIIMISARAFETSLERLTWTGTSDFSPSTASTLLDSTEYPP